jgi:hypothetical protein
VLILSGSESKFFDTMTWLRQFSDKGGTQSAGGARKKEKIVKGGSSKWFAGGPEAG